jgi:hypothetical protein
VQLFATSKTARETFSKLFFDTFGEPLERANPLQSGLRAQIGPELRAQLDRLEPIRWPRAEKAGELARAAKRPAPAVKAADDGEGDA